MTCNLPRNCNHAVSRSFRHTSGTNKAKTDFLSVQVNMPALPFTSIMVCMSHLQPTAFAEIQLCEPPLYFSSFALEKDERKCRFQHLNYSLCWTIWFQQNKSGPIYGNRFANLLYTLRFFKSPLSPLFHSHPQKFFCFSTENQKTVHESE